MKRETRSFPFEAEIRTDGDGERIVGYAAVFNALSEEMFGFREIIRRGAFKKTIQESDVRALFNHDPNFVLGRNKSGTLTLSEDDKGLRIEIDPPTTQIVRDLVMEPMRRGDIDQMSFGFRAVKDGWTKENGKDVRELLEVQLFDISPVTFPAYPQTEVSVRNIDVDILASIERKLRSDSPIDDWDRIYIQRAIDILTAYLGEPEPVPADHSDDEDEPRPAAHSLSLLRRRIELAERI